MHQKAAVIASIATVALVGTALGPADVLAPVRDLLQDDDEPHEPGCNQSDVRGAFWCLFEGAGGQESATWQEPNQAEQSGWQAAIDRALMGRCAPTASTEALRVRISQHDNVCWIVDDLDANQDGIWDRGWGAAAVRMNASSQLHLSAPHMQWDIHSGWQTLELFLQSDARSAAFSGTHRYAAPGPQGAGCKAACPANDPTTGRADESDMALQTNSMFQATTLAALNASQSAGVFVQMHGMADHQCGDLDGFFSEASDELPSARAPARLLRDAVAVQLPADTGWRWGLAGEHPGLAEDGHCHLTGGINVQAKAVKPYGAAFVHVEQKATSLDPDRWPDWIAALGQSQLDQPRAQRDVLARCPGATTANEAFWCLRPIMGQTSQGHYQTPSTTEFAAWKTTTAAMLQGDCRAHPDLPLDVSVGALDGVCVMVDLLDSDGNGRVDRGWGMVAVRLNSSSPVHVQVPQPLFVTNAVELGMHIFANTEARSFATPGAHPGTSLDGRSDTNTRTDTPLFAATEAVLLHPGNPVVWHPRGMYDTACTTGAWMDGYLAEGSQDPPGAVAAHFGLVAKQTFGALEPPRVVAQPGDAGSSCSLDGSDNVGGRAVLDAGGVFLNMQMKAALLAPEAFAPWAEVFEQAFES